MSDTTGSQSDQDATGQGAPSDDTEGTSSDAQDTTGSQQDSSSKSDDVVPRSEAEAYKARMQAADKRASDAEKKLEERERKERSDLENAQKDLEQAQARIAQLEQLVNSTAVETEFVKYGKHDWVDVEAALRLLDREGVEVKDGKVSGLGPAIEKLVKAKPYLLKANNNQNDSSGASGSASNGRRKGDGDAVKRDLSSRFPALRKPATAQK